MALVPVTKGHSALCVCSECMREVRCVPTPLPFPRGEHVPTYPRAELLRKSALDWMALAEEHNRAAREAIEGGDETTAILELAHAERKTEMARLAMVEARGVEAGNV